MVERGCCLKPCPDVATRVHGGAGGVVPPVQLRAQNETGRRYRPAVRDRAFELRDQTKLCASKRASPKRLGTCADLGSSRPVPQPPSRCQ